MTELNRRLIDTPHSLIAGTTGSGKSVLLNSVVCDLIEVGACLALIDLKRVELARYKNCSTVGAFMTEPEHIPGFLNGMCDIMEERYEEMEAKGLLKYDEADIFIVIDELADLMTYPAVLPPLVKLGRLGRAARMHMICATQDPSRRTLVAQLMQNFTACAALRCRSAIESRQIIGVAGAESLPKYGKCILWDADGFSRHNIPMLEDEEIMKICNAHSK